VNGRQIRWLLIPAMIALGAATAHAQARSIEAAVRHVATEISFGVREGAAVALVSVNSDTLRMSNYLVNGLTEALLNTGRVTMIDWSRQRDGVEYTVDVDLEPHSEGFRLIARVTRVEGSVIHGTHSAVVMRNDPVVVSLLGQAQQPALGARQPGVGAQPPGMPRPRPTYFTPGHRWGTFWLNTLIPGLGSFVIMRDTFGGVFQVITGVTGHFFTVFGAIYYHPGIALGMTILGILSQTTWMVYNIARSVSFTEDALAFASIPEQWNIAVIPGRGGIEQVALTHTRRF